jgi:EAL domain-containing protein (putative c-di-GMP-specific phosphodiesterase class I)
MVVQALARHGIAPERLVCEITETALIDDPMRAAENVEALHDAGVLVSLDDFCTGYSALEHLKRFPLSAIKLDRTFVAEVATNPADLAIVRGLVEIAGAMALSTVAEGVESPEQLARLREVGCDFAQGYLFAPAYLPDELGAYLRGLHGGVVDLASVHAMAAAAV